MYDETKTRLASTVRELGAEKLSGGEHEYPFSAMLWDMQTALGQLDIDMSPGLAQDAEAKSVHEAARGFLACAEDFFRIISTTATPDLRFGYEQLHSTVSELRQGPILVDRLAGVLVRHDEESPLLIDIRPLGRYTEDFRRRVDSAANQIKAILSLSDGSS